MSSRKSKGPNGNKKTRKHKLISNSKNIDDYLHDSLFPISPNEYITITLEICSELKGNPKYNYKVSSIKKHTFTQDIPDYNKYSSLTKEVLQEGIDKLNLKDPNSFIRLMLISRGEELKIWKLDNQKYEENTNNKEKCGYGTPIYEEIVPPVEKDLTIEDMEDWDIFEKELDDKNKQQVKENEARKLQAKEAKAKAEQERLVEEANAKEKQFVEESVVDYIPAPVVADEARIAAEEEQFAEESGVDYIPAPVVADEARIAAEAKAEEARDAAEANAEEERLAEEARVAAEAKVEEDKLAEEARVAAEAKVEEERLAEEDRVAAEAKVEEERLAEEARVAAESKVEEERLAEESRVATEAKAEDERFAKESVVEPEDIEQQMLSFTLDKLTKINKTKNLNDKLNNKLNDKLKSVFAEFNSKFEGKDIPDNLQKMFKNSLSNDESIQKNNIYLLLNGVRLLIIYKEINKKIELLKEIDDDKRLEFKDNYGLLAETDLTITTIKIDGKPIDIFEVMDKIANFNTLKPDQTKYILEIQKHIQKEIDIMIGKLTNQNELFKSRSNKDFFEDEDDADNGPWHNTKQELLKRIDKITDQVKQTKYEDDKTEISDNMDLLKVLVDELGNSYKLLTPIIDNIDPESGKNKCKTALNYIQNNGGENSTKANLYVDYRNVNSKYEEYINYKTSWLSRNEFEKHKNNFINELDNFKKNLKDKVFSTFEYGDSEYCKDISPNNNDDLIKSVEDANKRAETVLSQDDRFNPDKNTLLRSNSEPTIPIQTKPTTYTEKQYKNIVKNIIDNIEKSNDYSGKGKDIFIQNIGVDINKLLKNPKVKDRKQLHDILIHLSNYLQKYDSTPEQITHYLERVKTHLKTTYGGNAINRKKTKKKRTTRSTKQKSNTKTVKNMERKRKTRKNTK